MAEPLTLFPGYDPRPYFASDNSISWVTPERYMMPIVYSGQLEVAYGGLNGATTNNLPEGDTNLYFTNDRVGALFTDSSTIDFTYGATITGDIKALSVTNAMLAGSIEATKLVKADIILAQNQITNLVSDLAGKQPLNAYLTALSSGTLSGVTLTDTPSITMRHLGFIASGSGSGESFTISGYDTNDAVYRDFITIQSGATPTLSIFVPSGAVGNMNGVTINSAAGFEKPASFSSVFLTGSSGTDLNLLRFENTSATADKRRYNFNDYAPDNRLAIQAINDSNVVQRNLISLLHDGPVLLHSNVTLCGNNTSYSGGTGIIFIANRTATPGTNPTAGGYLYCQSGALIYRGSSGTITTIAVA